MACVAVSLVFTLSPLPSCYPASLLSCVAMFVAGWGSVVVVELCPAILFRLVFSVTALLIWGGVFCGGLCHCGMAVMVYVGAEERRCLLSAVNSSCVAGCGIAGCEGVHGLVCLVLLLSCLCLLCPLSSPLFFFVIGVRGSARAALRARTLSPNTIVFSLPIVCPLVSFLSSSFFIPRFSSVSEWRCVPTMCRSIVLA